MASLTVDQLKKSLIEHGVALPPSGSKKADYVKLYEQYSTLNENLGEFYSSDDENPPRDSSQSVTSSSSPSKIESIIKEVERLTDDELYSQLKELGASIGPVLKNTRKVYEKKLIKLLGSGVQTNGLEGAASRKTNNSFKVDEFSDSEVDLPSVKSSYKNVEHKTPFKGRKSSVTRDSPKFNSDEYIPEPAIEKKYLSHNFNEYDTKTKSFPNYESESKSSKFSFIETIPKGTTHRYIEPTAEIDYPSNSFRSRYYSEKPNIGRHELYTGTWEPNIKKYLNSQQPSKISKRTSSLSSKSSSYKENIIAGVIILLFILLILYIYFYQWSSADPYKVIEDDIEREIEHLTGKRIDNK